MCANDRGIFPASPEKKVLFTAAELVEEAINRECANCEVDRKPREFIQNFLRVFRDDGKTWPTPSYVREMIVRAKEALEG